MSELIYKDEAFQIIGICMEVHRILGGGFLEIVYKDALEYEFRKKGIYYEREKQFDIQYKEIILPHKYYADFTIGNEIILEVKAVNEIPDEFIKQTINYLAVSNYKLGLIINFGRDKLLYKRVVL
ncbi:MAG: GxxExxY protein [Bacteroidota bacterium]